VKFWHSQLVALVAIGGVATGARANSVTQNKVENSPKQFIFTQTIIRNFLARVVPNFRLFIQLEYLKFISTSSCFPYIQILATPLLVAKLL